MIWTTYRFLIYAKLASIGIAFSLLVFFAWTKYHMQSTSHIRYNIPAQSFEQYIPHISKDIQQLSTTTYVSINILGEKNSYPLIPSTTNHQHIQDILIYTSPQQFIRAHGLYQGDHRKINSQTKDSPGQRILYLALILLLLGL